jgi:hypothetical protein
MKPLTQISFLAILIMVINACGSIVPQQPQITETTPLEIPERTGAVRLPIEIDLAPYLNVVEKSLPKTFQGSEDNCDGVSFKYYFKREPIAFSGNHSTMAYNVNGEYNIRANYCAKCGEAFGSGPFCLTPRVYVSCGVGEPLRKIEIGFESKISIEPNYLLRSETSLTKTKVIDPCELSFIRYDASKIIEKEITAVLEDMEDEIDAQIRSVDLKTPIQDVWAALQTSIPIDGMGYLNFRPQEIDVEPIKFKDQTGFVTVNLLLSPIFSTDSISAPKKNLPFLSNIKTKKEFEIPLLTLASYSSINTILHENVRLMVIPYKRKKIIIESAKVLGPVGNRLLFEVQFSGSKKGRLYVLGTPTYDPRTRVISFPDMEFDIRSKDALLKSAKWLFDKKITNILREKAVYDLTDQIETTRLEIEKQLNTPLEFAKGQFVYLSGEMKDINISAIEVGANEIRLIADLKGKLSIKL